ncbi:MULTISPECIES: hypothetical protein [Methylorubrum]|jgi:hypothetical protein|uniref:Uncharacterized protein n=2 Tax=Methylorubrum TaxID=2282523 RepID=A0A514KLC3_9HYPH|nr:MULTISPECIES: hypothetical protein [Methylorubrum]KAB7786084.1 hypothetical protein F8B43_1485 [Methylorubrum populi]QDI80418.1 hypothetical protein E8E01_08245 [Methylorubrum populi]GJE83335.1 hypothetical protein CJNNKLLH_4706 [Methylorubrum thiocyanatum]
MRHFMRHTALAGLTASLVGISLVSSALAAPGCIDGRRKIQEASALRYQARQEARLGNHDRVCDTLDEIGDRYHEAQDAFEDCGADIVSIDLRSELRSLRVAKHVNRCD